MQRGLLQCHTTLMSDGLRKNMPYSNWGVCHFILGTLHHLHTFLLAKGYLSAGFSSIVLPMSSDVSGTNLIFCKWICSTVKWCLDVPVCSKTGITKEYYFCDVLVFISVSTFLQSFSFNNEMILQTFQN